MLSIVILAYNSQKYIKACLNSVFSQSAKDIEVIVVDNASTDGTQALVREGYPRVRLIENRSNLGASRARNQGIECSVGEWILAMDSDVVLENDFIRNYELAKGLFPEDLGMIQPNVLNRDGTKIYSQGIRLSVFRRFHDLNHGKPRNFVSSIEGKIIGPCSAAAFYRRSMLDALREVTGYFDERFFFLVEDVDLAWRAQRAGWKVLFNPQMVCSHTGNGSSTDKKLRQYLCFRNRYLMIAKNDTILERIVIFMISLPYEIMRCAYLAVSNKYLFSGFGKKDAK